MPMKKKGFTLIELLIVVAIIAILAAIAIPNFLMAQIRAKVGRAKSEIRTLATGVESYYVDYTAWPLDGTESWAAAYGWTYYWYVPNCLSTPISYISSTKINDPFRDALGEQNPVWRRYRYSELKDGSLAVAYKPYPVSYNKIMDAYGLWRLSSAGPDRVLSPDYNNNATPWGVYDIMAPYDPSNGTVSIGDIIRSQKHSNNYE
jgi:prepilin-type N-terminal cleavage/methylation domain-containing protein